MSEWFKINCLGVEYGFRTSDIKSYEVLLEVYVNIYEHDFHTPTGQVWCLLIRTIEEGGKITKHTFKFTDYDSRLSQVVILEKVLGITTQDN